MKEWTIEQKVFATRQLILNHQTAGTGQDGMARTLLYQQCEINEAREMLQELRSGHDEEDDNWLEELVPKLFAWLERNQ